MRRQLTPDFAIYYDDAGSGEPLVLLHAFPLSRAMWQRQREALQNEFRVITPDLRGFGGTGAFGQTPSLEQMADDVAQFLDTFGLKQVVLGGLSMGGYVALAFARKYPDRLRGLILADTRAEADSDEGKANRDKMIEFARTHTSAEVFEQLLPKSLTEKTRRENAELVAEVRRIAGSQSISAVFAALQAMRDRPDSSDVLPSIRVPVLVIVGSEDGITPPAVAQAMVGRLPKAELATVTGAGHLSNLEQPEAFNTAVRGYLRSLG